LLIWRRGQERESPDVTKSALLYLSTVIEISCLEVWREISNYIDQGVDPELRARMEAHFRVCSHCTAILDGTKNTLKLVADGVELDLPAGLNERLYRKIKNF
jgi:putative zinc finger protein